uniref:Mitochondrial import receptor subunit TOM22 homolog n=1 Tax=Dermatophagoides pteronyssinus TaxID=6956 RepID=A0A6P6YHU7_DERPT|nr:mitochondrial import receptor subunit TOM22 homolog [Dermatophagoides pteronyssinus]
MSSEENVQPDSLKEKEEEEEAAEDVASVEDITVLDKPSDDDENKTDLKLEDLASDNIVTPMNSEKSSDNGPSGTVAKIITILNDDIDDDDDDEEFEDETIVERLIGLTEMFPEPVRDFTWKFSTSSYSFGKAFYEFSRSAVWIISTTAIILSAPVLIESEKSQLEEMNRQQQRQILLGPSAVGATPSLTPPLKSV